MWTGVESPASMEQVLGRQATQFLIFRFRTLTLRPACASADGCGGATQHGADAGAAYQAEERKVDLRIKVSGMEMGDSNM